MSPALIALIVVAIFVIVVAGRTIRIVPQARAGIVERFGRYNKTLKPGLNIVVPFRRPLAPVARPARASDLVPAAARDHRRQPGRRHRHRLVLPGH